MRLFALLACAAALSFALMGGALGPAYAQKKNPACNPDACYKACAARGGQVRLCGTYCEKRIREDKRCR